MNEVKNHDITQVVTQNLCHSCGACFASCGHGSISFEESIGGFIVPKIEYQSCTNCGLCFDVCAGDHFGSTLQKQNFIDPFIGNIMSSEVGKASDPTIYMQGQSGGVTTALLASMLDTKQIEIALVAVMGKGEVPRGEFELIKNSKELYKSQRSKYTPIPLLKAIQKLKNTQGTIAIVGLSCHYHGLQNLMDVYSWLAQKEIIKIGLICDRVMSTRAIDFIAMQVTDKKIKNIIFRDTQRTSYPGQPVVITNEEDIITLPRSVRIYMKDFFTPLRCRLCFDKLNTFADIVMGDPHNIESTDRENGETLVLVRTDKGKEVLQREKQNGSIELRDVNMQDALNGQKIDQKKEEWSQYMNIWKELGHKIPEYPFDFVKKLVKKKEILKLQHALTLDTYSSKEKLLIDAQRYYYKKKSLFLVKFWGKKMIKKLLGFFHDDRD